MADDGVTLSNSLVLIHQGWELMELSTSRRYVLIKLHRVSLLTFKKIAPAHYSCNLNNAVSVTQNLLPGLYWANIIPDAEIVANLRVQDTTIEFMDVAGYHDKTYGIRLSSTDLGIGAGVIADLVLMSWFGTTFYTTKARMLEDLLLPGTGKFYRLVVSSRVLRFSRRVVRQPGPRRSA